MLVLVVSRRRPLGALAAQGTGYCISCHASSWILNFSATRYRSNDALGWEVSNHGWAINTSCRACHEPVEGPARYVESIRFDIAKCLLNQGRRRIAG
jgi:hypothetical protein